MLVSFIIVAYNAEESINNLLNNLKDQDYSHKMIEIILVDGRSSDKTKIIMDNFRLDNSDEFNRVLVLDNYKQILPFWFYYPLEYLLQ